MITLKDAREKGDIAKFIKEHRRDPTGEAAAFNHTLSAMARTSKAVRAASDGPHSGD